MDQDRLTLRALDSKTDIKLFREAYHWRKQKTSKLRPDRMSFDDFVQDDPSQIVMGLFNGSLCAIYLFKEVSRGIFDAHFTSRRDVPREYVVAGGRWMVRWFMRNGAEEVIAYVVEQNSPLRAFVEDVGFQVDTLVEFSSRQDDTDGGTVSPVRSFVKYAVRR